MPAGALSCALTAGPPSPENPAREFPATSARLAPLSRYTQLPAVKYRLPFESTMVRLGLPMVVLSAAAGVGGGAPPATVDIVYCCPCATGKPASNRSSAPPHSLETTGIFMYTLSLADETEDET